MAFYRIKDAAEKIGVPPHVLRFWESQFPQLKPNKTGRGQRLFDEEDVKSFLKIKHLLYVEGYSIPGAKKFLKEEHSGAVPTVASEGVSQVQRKLILNDIKQQLTSLVEFAREF